MITTLIAVGLSLLIPSAAQDPPPRPRAVCSTDAQYQWTFNILGQSPCEVAADLLDVCLGRDVYIVALDAGQRYPPAQASGEGNDCRCSTIYYSMLSACAYCQGRAWISWSSQTIPNCAATFDRYFPISMPSSVHVPSWANLDVVSQGAFDAAKARDSLNPTPPRPPPPPPPPPDPSSTKPRPDPTTTPRSTPTSADASSAPLQTHKSAGPTTPKDSTKSTLPGQITSTQTLTASPAASPPVPSSKTSLDNDAVSDPKNEKRKPPIGPIIAGVGGGILLIAILCGLYVIFHVRRRRRVDHGVGSHTVPSTAVSPFLDNPAHGDGRTISPEMSNQFTGTGMESVISTSRSNVYNPFADGAAERTISPSGVSAQYTSSITDPSYVHHDRSITKGHHTSPSFTTTISHPNSTSSPPYLPQTENTVSATSAAPLRPVRRVPDDDMHSMRTSTRLSRGGYLPPPYDPATAPPMPSAVGKS